MFPKLADIRKIRERAGLSQQELADRIGISQSAIPKYENGKQVPNYNVATRMFELLLEHDNRYDPELEKIMERNLMLVKPSDKAQDVFSIMRKNSISQIPVLRNKIVVGTMNDALALDFINRDRDTLVEEIMIEPLPMVPKSAKIKDISPLLKKFNAVLINHAGTIEGIITKADLLEIS
ncbi:MAG: CBS domain-containing protein [Candidatus Heimdallarchaeota archaeon]|nr:CBS domain-containing protein [Candidatus Heimdallarchaeota archaeon]